MLDLQVIRGNIRGDKKTKKLTKKLLAGEVALIDHNDIDEVAARSLIEKKIKVVLNTGKSITGRYPNKGPEIILNAGINLIELPSKKIWEIFKNGQEVIIKNNKIFLTNNVFYGNNLDLETINEKLEFARNNLNNQFESFVKNTIDYAKKEIDIILKEIKLPSIKANIRGRQCLIVVRGQNYKRDLKAIKPYINEKKPVIIGVDGGADALIEEGYKPDLIIGDMDSVSDKALNSGAEIIVHAYVNGNSPGLKRIESLNLKAEVLPAAGTSEDIAMLLAYEKKASLIVAVGSHSNVIDFLEKGRKGMASTFLVRLKVGSILVDARGVNQLYKQNIRFKHIAEIFLAALIPFTIVFLVSPPAFQLLRLILIKIKFLFQV